MHVALPKGFEPSAPNWSPYMLISEQYRAPSGEGFFVPKTSVSHVYQLEQC